MLDGCRATAVVRFYAIGLRARARVPIYGVVRAAAVRPSPRKASMPPVTTALIVANVAMFLLQNLVPQLIVPFALWPLATSAMSIGASFAPWQLVTYAFLHGSL